MVKTKKLSGIIDPRWINKAKGAGACQDAINWLDGQQRTWEQLRKEKSEWYVWALSVIHELPLDLDGLCLPELAQVMAYRPDCPIDLTGMPSYYRALVMIHRHDCPLDLTGLAHYHLAKVMAYRSDCPISLEGLKPFYRILVMTNRKDCPVSYKGLNKSQVEYVYSIRTSKKWKCPPVPKWAK